MKDIEDVCWCFCLISFSICLCWPDVLSLVSNSSSLHQCLCCLFLDHQYFFHLRKITLFFNVLGFCPPLGRSRITFKAVWFPLWCRKDESLCFLFIMALWHKSSGHHVAIVSSTSWYKNKFIYHLFSALINFQRVYCWVFINYLQKSWLDTEIQSRFSESSSFSPKNTNFKKSNLLKNFLNLLIK